MIRTKKLVLALCFMTAVMFQAVGDMNVTVYGDNDPELYGRAMLRIDPVSMDLSSFHSYDTIMAPQPGIDTAVVMEAMIYDILEDKLKDIRHVNLDDYIIDRDYSIDLTVYTVTFKKYGLGITFSLHKPGEGVLAQIRQVYKSDDYWRPRVLDRYNDNYIIRIHSCEDIYNTSKKEVSFQEALIAATILGDSEQWLWGIHDGLGMMADVADILKTMEPEMLVKEESEPVIPMLEEEPEKSADFEFSLSRSQIKFLNEVIDGMVGSKAVIARLDEKHYMEIQREIGITWLMVHDEKNNFSYKVKVNPNGYLSVQSDEEFKEDAEYIAGEIKEYLDRLIRNEKNVFYNNKILQYTLAQDIFDYLRRKFTYTDNDEHYLPQQVEARGTIDADDGALYMWKTLRDAGIPAKIVVIKNPYDQVDMGEHYNTAVLFKAEENWMWMDIETFGQDTGSHWIGIPAKIFKQSVVFAEIDVTNTWIKGLSEKNWRWQTSSY